MRIIIHSYDIINMFLSCISWLTYFNTMQFKTDTNLDFMICLYHEPIHVSYIK